jgi:hypothetical protein
MKSVQRGAIALLLAIFLLIGGGCAEQKKNSQEKGEAVLDTVKEAEKKIDEAVMKFQEKTNQLEETNE